MGLTALVVCASRATLEAATGWTGQQPDQSGDGTGGYTEGEQGVRGQGGRRGRRGRGGGLHVARAGCGVLDRGAGQQAGGCRGEAGGAGGSVSQQGPQGVLCTIPGIQRRLPRLVPAPLGLWARAPLGLSGMRWWGTTTTRSMGTTTMAHRWAFLRTPGLEPHLPVWLSVLTVCVTTVQPYMRFQKWGVLAVRPPVRSEATCEGLAVKL